MRGCSAWLLAVAACDDASGECRTRLDCAQDEHCFADPHASGGICVPTLGYTPSPPLEISAAQGARALLLVVDDDPQSAELQRRLVASIPAMVGAAQSSRLRLRVAVTSGTVAGPFCDSRAEARSGRFAATSCLDRLDDFIADDGTDNRALCTDACARTTAELVLTAGRPWVTIESDADPASIIATLACLVPQGTSGCERPAPLGAIELALMREWNEAEEEHGFRHPHSWPAALIVTDGMDCTTTDFGQAAFDPLGSRALWPDPDADTAPPAVCWSAGVECTGAPPLYEDCEPANRDLEGMSTHVTTSVLTPEDLTLGAFIDIHAIGGVPVDGDVVYSTRGDASFVAQHGIAPGCDDGTIRAVPPLRLDAYSHDLRSVCAPSYEQPLADLATGAPTTFCFEACRVQDVEVVASADASAPRVPRCEDESSIPDSASACHRWIRDSSSCKKGQTELVVRTRGIGNTGSVFLSPNPFAPSTESCE